MSQQGTRSSIKGLKRLLKDNKYARIRKPVNIVILHKEKLSLRQIGERLKVSKDTARTYINRYKNEGIEGLFPRPKSGRPTYLKRELEASLVERIQQGPVEHDDVSVLTAKYIRKIIEEEYGTTYSVSGTEKLLKRLNFSKGKPRPHHEKHDEEAIKRWKESTLPNFVKFTADQHPKKNFKFGIRMKADLEKKPG